MLCVSAICLERRGGSGSGQGPRPAGQGMVVLTKWAGTSPSRVLLPYGHTGHRAPKMDSVSHCRPPSLAFASEPSGCSSKVTGLQRAERALGWVLWALTGHHQPAAAASCSRCPRELPRISLPWWAKGEPCKGLRCNRLVCLLPHGCAHGLRRAGLGQQQWTCSALCPEVSGGWSGTSLSLQYMREGQRQAL